MSCTSLQHVAMPSCTLSLCSSYKPGACNILCLCNNADLDPSGCAASIAKLLPSALLSAAAKYTLAPAQRCGLICLQKAAVTAYGRVGQQPALELQGRQGPWKGLQTCLSRQKGARDLRLQVVGELLFGQACLQAEVHSSCYARHLQRVLELLDDSSQMLQQNRNLLGRHLLTEAATW